MTVRVDDILDHLVSRSAAPSTMGAQLDRLRFGIATQPDPFRARDEAEDQILEQARILRCMAEFAARGDFGPNYKDLEKIQKKAPALPQGHIALNCLRAYQEWSTQSKERALVAVYLYLRSIAPSATPPPISSEPDLTQAFRAGKAKRARTLAASVYADCLLALGAFVTVWNKKYAANRKGR